MSDQVNLQDVVKYLDCLTHLSVFDPDKILGVITINNLRFISAIAAGHGSPSHPLLSWQFYKCSHHPCYGSIKQAWAIRHRFLLRPPPSHWAANKHVWWSCLSGTVSFYRSIHSGTVTRSMSSPVDWWMRRNRKRLSTQEPLCEATAANCNYIFFHRQYISTLALWRQPSSEGFGHFTVCLSLSGSFGLRHTLSMQAWQSAPRYFKAKTL